MAKAFGAKEVPRIREMFAAFGFKSGNSHRLATQALIEWR